MAGKDREWLRYAAIGPHMLVCLVIGYYFGSRWMDRWFDSAPLWTVVFTLLGLAAGFLNLFREVMRANKEGENEGRDEEAH